VKIEWSPAARASARRYLADQDGMRAIGMAIASLADHPYPPEAFHRGDYHRLRVGPYRVIYVIDGDLITIERVDRVSGS
jgi:mRNA-degrading endonuclease RelE of RelBE toxin-antitoxin system